VADPEEFGPEFRASTDLALLTRSTAEANAVLPENASLRQVLHALRGVSSADADRYEAAETLDLSEVDRILRAARLKVVLAEGQG
jgi:hypothetical protein